MCVCVWQNSKAPHIDDEHPCGLIRNPHFSMEITAAFLCQPLKLPFISLSDNICSEKMIKEFLLDGA